MNRIVCVGNRYAAQDAAGPKVYDRLVQRALPPGIEVIDGVLAGLDLLRFVEGARRVIFFDAVVGFAQPGNVVVLGAGEAANGATGPYDHAAGIAYLFRLLPHVCDEAMPEVVLVGIEGDPDDETICAAANTCLEIATSGPRPCVPTLPERPGDS